MNKEEFEKHKAFAGEKKPLHFLILDVSTSLRFFSL